MIKFNTTDKQIRFYTEILYKNNAFKIYIYFTSRCYFSLIWNIDVYKRQVVQCEVLQYRLEQYNTLSKTRYINVYKKKFDNRQSYIYTLVNNERTHTTHDFIDSGSNGRHQRNTYTASESDPRVLSDSDIEATQPRTYGSSVGRSFTDGNIG